MISLYGNNVSIAPSISLQTHGILAQHLQRPAGGLQHSGQVYSDARYFLTIRVTRLWLYHTTIELSV